MKIAIVKYNAGNIQSVLFALQRLGHTAIWTDEAAILRTADRVIFPGVGEASSAMAFLKTNGLDEVICSLQQPVLGICLGMQLFCKHSAENDTPCLGIFDVEVKRFEDATAKVPHMGWNTIENLQGDLFQGINAHTWMYYVHSYYAAQCSDTCATTDYIVPFSAALQRDNFYAVQFHPEKSSAAGQRLLENFINL